MRSDARRLSHFRDDAARTRFLTVYDEVLRAWSPAPVSLDVETRYGNTHLLSCGAESGTPIVLLHGLAVPSPSWYANVGALGVRHPVYALDTITDAGRSKQTVPIRDAAQMSLWLDDALGALDLRNAHLVGLSYGGWLALNHAHRVPDSLASITAVEPAGALGRMKFNVKMLPDGFRASVGKSDPALIRLLRQLNNGSLPPDPILELSVAALRTFRVTQPFPRRLTEAQLRSITTPTLVLFGARSPVTDAQRAVDRARLVPDAVAEVIPDAGHALPTEHPEVFNRRVLQFIDAVDEKRCC